MTPRKLDLRTARARVAHLERRLETANLTARALRSMNRGSQIRDSFISICAVMAGRGSFLHALDGWGKVWRYNHQTDEWNSIGMKRGGPVAVRSIEPQPVTREA